MFLRRFTCFSGRAQPSAQAEHAQRVEAVLRSRGRLQALGLAPAAEGAGAAPGAGARREAGALDLEVGLIGAVAAERLSDAAITEAFLRVAVEVHPFRNSHPEATQALRWLADAYAGLRSAGRGGAAAEAQPWGGIATGEECPTGADEALRLFAEAVAATHDRLQLYDLAQGGISKAVSDALLRGLHVLHLRPYARDRAGSRERAMLDAVLAGALAANWFLVGMARLLSRPSQRWQSEWRCSTIVAALGSMAFGNATRLQRMMTNTGGGSVSLGAPGSIVDMLEPLVRCPLCRLATPAGRAIQDVHAGEATAACCVCTERSADVCLPCGHLCLCGDCFKMLPRTTAAAA